MTPNRSQQPIPNVSALILAGGQSTRLGQDKSLLTLGGQPLVRRIVDGLAVLSDDLVLVTNHPDRYDSLDLPVRMVPDEQQGMGALMGIYSGLRAARYPHALVIACDMPFLCLPLLRYMLTLSTGFDVVVPRLDGLMEPLHAIYSKECLSPIASLLAQGRRQIIAFFDQVRVRHVTADEIDRFDPDHFSFVNVNTPTDWERVRRLLRERRKASA